VLLPICSKPAVTAVIETRSVSSSQNSQMTFLEQLTEQHRHRLKQHRATMQDDEGRCEAIQQIAGELQTQQTELQ